MTTATLVAAKPTAPFGLWRADLLKLRRRRGLVATVGMMTVGVTVVMYSILAVLHAAEPTKHGPAGGITTFGHGVWALTMLGGVAAVIAGASAGADDLSAGVFRELVTTGRSRLALFGAKVSGGLAFLLPFVVVAYAIAGFTSRFAAGSLPAPSVSLLMGSFAWVVASCSFWFVVGLGIASLTGSRAQTLGLVLAFRLILSPIIISIGWFGSLREVIPQVDFDHFAPAQIRDMVSMGQPLSPSVFVGVAVLGLWVVAALAVGGWRTATRDA